MASTTESKTMKTTRTAHHTSPMTHRLATATLLIAALSALACDGGSSSSPTPSISTPDSTVGSGQVISESRAVSGFHGVSLSGPGRLLIDRNGFESLVVTADDNVLPHLTSVVAGGMLELGIAPAANIRTSTLMTYEVSASTLDEIRVSGPGGVEALGLDTAHFRLDFSGVGGVTTYGRADYQDVTVTGVGRYDGDGVTSHEVTISVSGAAYACVRASDRLNATVHGAGVLEYYGDPELNVTGDGTVRRLGP